jgi:citrate lyase subunit beta / citryl-CoA lyase
MRTFLYVPGDREDRIPKALRSGADAVILDLEDAVAPPAKPRARRVVAAALARHPDGGDREVVIGVRVNAEGSGLLADDLRALEPRWAAVDFLVLPMVDSAADVRAFGIRIERLSRALGRADAPRIVPLIETAAGVIAAADIAAAHPSVWTLALGPADLSAQLGIDLTPEGAALMAARSALVLAAAAAGLRRPIDGPWLNVSDTDGLRTWCASGRRLGFGAAQAVHPRQLQTIREAFRATDAQRRRAEAILAAVAAAPDGPGAFRLDDGTMVDAPVIARARDVLDG